MIADLTTPATFEERVALVTGGGSGIGQATARLLASRGARVVVADADRQQAEATAASLGPDVALAVTADVTAADAVQAMVERAVEVFGRLDVAVNAAGTSGEWSRTGDRELDEWGRVVAVNLTGAFLCVRAEVRAMLATLAADAGGGAAIVNVSSGAGAVGVAGLSHYAASKHGVVGLTRSAALEYARKGIRINGVLPGPVRTPMLRAFAGDDAGIDAMGAALPAGRAGEAAEIAQAIAWLCSDQASFVTGHMLAVDGGALAT